MKIVKIKDLIFFQFLDLKFWCAKFLATRLWRINNNLRKFFLRMFFEIVYLFKYLIKIVIEIKSEQF